MTTNDDTRGIHEARAGWPAYLEPLRPDEMTRRRLGKRVMAAADALLQGRAPTWFDVTASWSSVLAPLAAGLLVVFGALAWRASVPTEDPLPGPEVATQPAGLVPSLAPDALGPPALLTAMDEPSRDAVLAALLVDER